MGGADREVDRLQRELDDLRRQLDEANDTLRAIRSGEVDAVVVHGREGKRLYTLESAYEPYRVFVEQMQQGAASVTSDGLILYSNTRFAQILGVPDDRLLGTSIFSVVDDSHHDVLASLLAAAPDHPQDAEMVVATPDGRHVHILFFVTAMPDGTRCAVLTDITERVRQRDLLASNEWLQVTLGSIGDAVVSCDATGRITFLNAVAETLTGWPRAEALGQPINTIFRIVNEVTHEPLEDLVLRVLRDGQVIQLGNHTALLTRDGRELPIEDSAAPIRDKAGELAGAVLVFQDATRRRQAQRALQESEAKFRALFEYSADAVFLTVPDGRILAANPTAREMFGMTEQEICERGREGLVDSQDPRAEEVREHRRRTGSVTNLEAIYIRKNGERFPGETSSVVLPGDSPRAFVVVRDVTERKRAEEAVRQRETDYARAQAIAHLGSWRWNLATDTVSWSAEMYRMFGVDPSSFVPSKEAVDDIIHPDDHARYAGLLGKALGGERVAPFEVRIIRPSHEQRTVLASGFDVESDTTGRPMVLFGTVLDITDRKRAEDALREANAQLGEADRRKDEFIAILSHELRNPLAPIRYALPVLQAQKLGDVGSRAIAVIDRQVDHLTRLVDDLLDVSRITRGKIQLRHEYITLASVITAAAEAAAPAMVAARHNLKITVPEEPIWLHADAARISQVITNLLNNSAKYTPRGGEIILAAERDDTAAVIRVRDNGIGIPPEALRTVFDMFTQVTRPDRSQGGLGIGLALVKRLVEMHGGTIEAHSGGSGQGAEFIVRLPIVAEVRSAAGSQPTSAGKTAGGERLRVLIVDDNADLVDMLAVAVESAGHEVRKALDGPSAISAALSYRPHVVFLDLGLPEMSGLEVAKELRRHPETAGARLVALTGWGQPEDRRLTQEAGFEHHLTKPTEPAVLQRLLAQLASKRHS